MGRSGSVFWRVAVAWVGASAQGPVFDPAGTLRAGALDHAPRDERRERVREGRMLIFINHVFLRLPFAARSIASGSAAEGEAGVRSWRAHRTQPLPKYGAVTFRLHKFR